MIEASFGTGREAAIDGVYQYDTGQRLRLSGLPSPDELAEMDELLSGDLVAVQAQFSFVGDSQAEMRLARWDDERWAWMVDIPDQYLTRHEEVHVYVYVSYGADESGSRNKTCYEGVFTPISRPAPNNTVTDDQLEQWETLEAEVDLALVSVQTATDNAKTQTDAAKQAAQNAASAAETAQEAAGSANTEAARLDAIDALWGDMAVTAVTLAQGAEATAQLDGQMLTLGIPRGATGPQGEQGAAGPTDITLTLKDGVLTITPK